MSLRGVISVGVISLSAPAFAASKAGRRTFANNYNYAVIVKLQLKAEERQIEREGDRY